MAMQVVEKTISIKELKKIAKNQFGDLVKAVVDVEKGIMAIGGELHADEEIYLFEKYSSKRENTWGINFYPDKTGNAFIEFDSMINIKPQHNNRSRGVDDPKIQEKIKLIVNKLVK